MDIQPHWEEKRLFLVRTSSIPEGGGILSVSYVEADSKAAAMDTLRLDASQGEEAEYSDSFHFWTIEDNTGTADKTKESKQSGFVKPWEVLSRVSKE